MSNYTELAMITHPDCLLHEMGISHLECPQRIQIIADALQHSGLMTYALQLNASLATSKDLLRTHTHDYVEQIFQLAPKGGYISLDPDTIMNPYTLTAALRAAGAVIQAVDLTQTNQAQIAFCNVRPPGHHAERATAMGFCFFNNLAVGVAYALEKYQLRRIAIVDFDVHHGNGTEDIFRNDERVLLCSSFQHPFYPFVGANTQSNHIINVPLPAGTTSETFRSQVSAQWFDAILKFKPELIFFSAGFDAHQQDPLGQLQLITQDYEWLSVEISRIAKQVCSGRMISVLEGGYNLSVLGDCVVAHLRGLCS